MNKGEFLQKLRERLSVLNENELEDILNEYEQHIDMKTAGSMTEEEAIADFGDLNELAAQILEAYHVRADFAGNGKESSGNAADEDAVQRAYVKAKGALTGGWKDFVAALKQAGHFLNEKADACADAIVRFFREKKEAHKAAKPDVQKMQNENGQNVEPQDEEQKQQTTVTRAAQDRDAVEHTGRRNAGRRTIFSVIGDAVHWCCHMLGSCIYGCWKAAVWCVKLCWRMGIWCVKNGWKVVVWAAKACWNLFWGCTGIVSGMFACMCLFGMGLLLVLLVQGYPLVGITIGMLGLTLCAGSVTIWCFTLPIRRKKEEAVGSGEETAQTEEELTGEGEAVHA